MRAITWSCGGGTQSVGIGVLIATGKLPRPDWAGIADTSREATETWRYLDAYLRPLLWETQRLEIEVVPHSLATVDLYSGNGDLLVPVFTATGKLDTFCSTEWKKRVVQRRLREIGYGPSNPVTTWIGISLDEIGRVKPSGVEWQEYDWPLLIPPAKRRSDCVAIIHEAGLPPAPKSSCWMCAHRRNEQWRRLRDFELADFEAACRFDEEIRERDGRGGVYLHRSLVPLREADLSEPETGMSPLFGEVEGCDSGMCWV